MGNLIDRASTGVVRDFVNIGIRSIRTGVFNLADLAIATGAVIVLCSYQRRRDGRGDTALRAPAREPGGGTR